MTTPTCSHPAKTWQNVLADTGPGTPEFPAVECGTCGHRFKNITPVSDFSPRSLPQGFTEPDLIDIPTFLRRPGRHELFGNQGNKPRMSDYGE